MENRPNPTIVDGWIEGISTSFRNLRNELALSHPSGELELILTFTTRMDVETHAVPIPKIKLSFCHYQNYENHIKVEGLEWLDTKDELFRKLKRDATLKRLTQVVVE